MNAPSNNGIPKNHLAVVKEFEESFRQSFRGGDIRESFLDIDDPDDTVFVPSQHANIRSSITELPSNRLSSPGDLNAEAHHDTITAKESKGVNALKITMYLTLIFSAVIIGTATFWFLQDEKLRLLELEVEAIAGEAVSDVEAYLDGISSQLFQLGMSFSSEYQTVFTNGTSQSSSSSSSSPSSWVDLTLPHFDQRIKNDPKSELIFYAPIIPSGSDVLLNEWTNYSVQNQNWIDEALAERGWDAVTTQIPEQIYSYASSGQAATTTVSSTDNILDHEVVTPIWQVSPVPRDRSIVNLNAMSVPVLSNLWHVSSSSVSDPSKARLSASLDGEFFQKFVESAVEEQETSSPESFLSTPVYKTFDRANSGDTTPFGYMFGLVSWQQAVSMAFQESHVDLSIQLQELCGSNLTMTFLVQGGGKTTYQPPGAPPVDLIDPDFKEDYDIPHEGCNYHMTVHPLAGAENAVTRDVPLLGFIIAGFLLVFLVVVFYCYNKIVWARQVKLLATAKRSNAVVSSLFPEAVQNRLMEEVVEQEQSLKPESRRQFLKRTGSKDMAEGKIDEESEHMGASKNRGKAIADLFPETTIMFADIVGFTAWSSMREPTQVFELLESIYSCFDDIARKRRVFKVETIGDCYVAVAGLPDPCEEHAIVMARFAHDCRTKMNEIVKELEVTLGPDTTDLCMRIGLHSGPVTAGVLRGDKARFQLFGDTMNTTSRIETTGKANRVHISEQTAQYLMDAGKKHWLALRKDKVTAKGKGELTTYWLRISKAARGRRNSLASSASTRSMGEESVDNEPPLKKADDQDGLSEKELRLVDWITNELERFLARIECKRNLVHAYPDSSDALQELEQQSLRNLTAKMPLDEYVDIIDFPAFDADLTDFLMMSKRGYDFSKSLDATVKVELHDYVKNVASMYKDNHFHNFEHASHVTMSVAKLISRIVTPGNETDVNDNAMKLHECTYGIASDPLTQFAMALSSLIHDADHPGVPNTRLIKDNDPLSVRYKKKSMAEQNSLDKSWRLLLDQKYTNLRRTIYQTKSEYQRFRQVVVNTVIATDIMDKALIEKQRERWGMAFKEQQEEEDSAEMMNRRATVVIEHVIQASDIAHTMQHWHVYRKWNGRLFEEMYKAFTTKRGEFNPADKWYQGEIDFFDFYIIPLAQKLKDCGVFGVSGDELLNYSQQNRQEWFLDGKKAVQTMLKAMRLESDGPIRGVSRYASSDSMSLAGSLHGAVVASFRGSGGTAKKGPRSPSRSRKPAPRTRSPRTRSPVRRTSAESSHAPSVASKHKDLLLQTMNMNNSLDQNSFDLELTEEFESFEDLSHQSDLTQDSYARKGKDLKLPEELHVLIIDDDNLNRRLFIRAIMSLAPTWVVSEAESVEEALDVIEKSTASFDVIFMDHDAGSIVGDFVGSSAVKLLRIKGVNSLICAMSERDKKVMVDTMEGDVFGNTALPFEPKALLNEVTKIMYQSGDFDW